MKILVADDSKTNLALITHSLKKLGHEVLVANNGEQAIATFQAEHPDLIILDVVMEGMSGFECAKKIRAINDNDEDWIPIIFLSGAVDDTNIARGIDAGGDDYLAKPCSEVTLAAKIKAMQRIADMRQKLYEAKQQLTILSATDALTGLYNRLHFDKTLKEKIDHVNRHHCTMALLFMDIDKFKEVNDKLGHHIGDLLLIQIAQRLKQYLREDDFVARIGGDEFSIILSEVSQPEAVGETAQKIIEILSSNYHLEQYEIHISASIGIAFYHANGNQITILKNADNAMYRAKKAGRNNYRYFEENYA